MKVPFKFTAPPAGWVKDFPDGDYTVGRGADPRPTENAGPNSANRDKLTKKRRSRRPAANPAE